MKLRFILLLFTCQFSFFLSAQKLKIDTEQQIDAQEIKVGPSDTGEEIILFVNHTDSFSLAFDEVSHLGKSDIAILGADNGSVEYYFSFASTANEKMIDFTYDLRQEDSLFFLVQFEDSLNIVFANDVEVLLSSSRSPAIGIFAVDDDQDQATYVSYLYNADSLSIQSAAVGGNLYISGAITDSLYHEGPTGTIHKIYPPGQENLFLMKLTKMGDLEWVRTYETSEQPTLSKLLRQEEDVTMLSTDSQGSTLRQINSEGAILKELKWPHTVLSDVRYYEGNIFVSGSADTELMPDLDPGAGTFTLPSSGSKDGVMLAHNFNGDLLWAQHIAGPADSHMENFDIREGELYTTGHIQGESTFSDGTLMLSASDADLDFFVAKYSTNGDFSWARSWTGLGDDSGDFLAIGETDEGYKSFHLLVSFTGDLTIDDDDMHEYSFEDNYEGSDRSFIYLYIEDMFTTSTTHISEHSFVISPNPATDRLEFTTASVQGTYEIYTTTGVPVLNGSLLDQNIDVSRLPIGTYCLSVTTEDGTSTQLFVKK